MNTPLVSICCITYNHAHFIRKCLDGFLMQKTPLCVPHGTKMSDWCEILIHDDCSTDGTTEIIKEYAAKYPDLIFPLYEEENQYSKGKAGKMDLYNYERAKGKYIAYCEGDDYWTEPLKLQMQVDFLESHSDYSVTFHRCKHVNVSDSSEREDGCGFLFTNNEEGVNINVELFFKHWVTQPLTMVCRSSMHDITLAYKYKYYRDMYEIYHLLINGKGYLFGFDGGIRIMHGGGIASLRNDEEICKQSIVIAKELYSINKDKYTKQYYVNILQWYLTFINNNFFRKVYVSLIILIHNRRFKKFIKNIIL